MNEKTTYAVEENLKENNNWIELLHYVFERAEYVEFNTTYDYHNLIPQLTALDSDLVEEGRGKEKFFSSGVFRRYRLSKKLKEFILSKKYASWKGYQFEDISFILNGKEIMATITHENFIYLQMDENERKRWNSTGFTFGKLFEK